MLSEDFSNFQNKEGSFQKNCIFKNSYSLTQISRTGRIYSIVSQYVNIFRMFSKSLRKVSLSFKEQAPKISLKFLSSSSKTYLGVFFSLSLSQFSFFSSILSLSSFLMASSSQSSSSSSLQSKSSSYSFFVIQIFGLV